MHMPGAHSVSHQRTNAPVVYNMGSVLPSRVLPNPRMIGKDERFSFSALSSLFSVFHHHKQIKQTALLFLPGRPFRIMMETQYVIVPKTVDLWRDVSDLEYLRSKDLATDKYELESLDENETVDSKGKTKKTLRIGQISSLVNTLRRRKGQDDYARPDSSTGSDSGTESSGVELETTSENGSGSSARDSYETEKLASVNDSNLFWEQFLGQETEKDASRNTDVVTKHVSFCSSDIESEAESQTSGAYSDQSSYRDLYMAHNEFVFFGKSQKINPIEAQSMDEIDRYVSWKGMDDLEARMPCEAMDALEENIGCCVALYDDDSDIESVEEEDDDDVETITFFDAASAASTNGKIRSIRSIQQTSWDQDILDGRTFESDIHINPHWSEATHSKAIQEAKDAETTNSPSVVDETEPTPIVDDGKYRSLEESYAPCFLGADEVNDRVVDAKKPKRMPLIQGPRRAISRIFTRRKDRDTASLTDLSHSEGETTKEDTVSDSGTGSDQLLRSVPDGSITQGSICTDTTGTEVSIADPQENIPAPETDSPVVSVQVSSTETPGGILQESIEASTLFIVQTTTEPPQLVETGQMEERKIEDMPFVGTMTAETLSLDDNGSIEEGEMEDMPRVSFLQKYEACCSAFQAVVNMMEHYPALAGDDQGRLLHAMKTLLVARLKLRKAVAKKLRRSMKEVKVGGKRLKRSLGRTPSKVKGCVSTFAKKISKATRRKKKNNVQGVEMEYVPF